VIAKQTLVSAANKSTSGREHGDESDFRNMMGFGNFQGVSINRGRTGKGTFLNQGWQALGFLGLGFLGFLITRGFFDFDGIFRLITSREVYGRYSTK
jgi:hypothetical protein